MTIRASPPGPKTLILETSFISREIGSFAILVDGGFGIRFGT